MTRTVSALTSVLVLLAAACTSASEQDVRIAELEATIASGRLAQAEATIQVLQSTPIPAFRDAPAPAAGRVRLVKAFDGDSGIATDANGEFEFRLYGIDAPERDDTSRAALESLIARFGSNLHAEERDVDRYGRRVVVLQTADGSRSVNVEMVRQGHAYAYLDYGELDGVVAAEAEAQANGHGVWAPPATPTWDEYWIDQDRQGNFRKTFDDYLYSDPDYPWANSRVKEYMESLYEPLKAQFDFAQTIGPYIGFRGAAATSLHFRGYLESGLEIWEGATWGPLLQATYDLMSDTTTLGTPADGNQAKVKQALDRHGYSTLRSAFGHRGQSPIAAQMRQGWLEDQWRGFRGELGPSAHQSDFFMKMYLHFG